MIVRRCPVILSITWVILAVVAPPARALPMSGIDAFDDLVRARRLLQVRQWNVVETIEENRPAPAPASSSRNTFSGLSMTRSEHLSTLQIMPLDGPDRTESAPPSSPPPAPTAPPASTSISTPASNLSPINRVTADPPQPRTIGSLHARLSASTGGVRKTEGSTVVSNPTTTAPRRSAAPATFDARLNFSDGPFPAADRLTIGTPSAWYQSEVVTDLLGGRPPTAEERAAFSIDVMNLVEKTFLDSGLDVDLTTEPVDAAHTLSVVSEAHFPDNPAAIGIADLGGDGFSFIDNFDDVDSINDLEVALAKNISHELMHAFGGEHHDPSGDYIDAGSVSWSVLTDRNARFSPEAVAELSALDFQERWEDRALVGLQRAAHDHGPGCDCAIQDAARALATPEPSTLAIWALAIAGSAFYAQGRRKTLGRA